MTTNAIDFLLFGLLILAATVTGAILYVVLGVRIGIIDFSGLPRGRLVSFYRNKGRLEGEAKSLSPNHGTEVT